MLLKHDLTKTGNIGLTLDGYFPNGENRCGISSLANLIYFQYNDFDTAKEIFVNSKNSPLVGYDGSTNMTSIPEILESLSNNRYKGLLHFNPVEKDINYLGVDLRGRSLESLQKAFKDSLEKGSFNFKEDISVNAPYILCLDNSNDPSIGHFLVNAGNFFINDGHIEYSLLNGWNIAGVFQAFKK